jgi:Domain of unknown function (DUF4157)
MNERVQSKAALVPKPSFSPFRSNLLQRKCACGGTPGLDGECAECRRKRLLGSERNLLDQADQSIAPPIVQEVLRSPGRPLDARTNASMKAHLGHDFSQVRIYPDAKAQESARVVEARAYTVGNRVVFGAGQYAPQTRAGQQLLAHELAHTLQQRAAPTHVPERLMLGVADSQLENEADSAAMAVGQGVSVASPKLSAATPMVQRQGTTVSVDIEEATPEEAERLRRQGVQVPRVSAATSDPRIHSDYVDRRVQAVGYGIYLGGYLLYCEGLELPVFVPESFVNLGLTNAASVNNSVYPDYDSAQAAIPYGPWAEGQAAPYAYYRAAGGALPLIVPTMFSPATTPRTVETMLGARRMLAEGVQQELTAVAIGLLGGMVLRALFSVIARVGGGRAPRTPPAAAPKIRPVNGRINVGGGHEAGSQNATNLNPIVTGTGGPGPNAQIPNHVRAGFEQIDEVFEAGSANQIYSSRLPYHTVNWTQSANGASKVMASGGQLHLNVWTRTAQEVKAIIDAFTKAGFRNVRNETGLIGPGTVITGIKP